MIIDQLFTRPIFESQMDPITQFASNAHEEWRRNFDPTGTKPRIKKNSDGTEGDINVPFADLHPDWQKENLAAGRAAQHAVKHFGNSMEKAAEFIHRQWMKRNPKADYNAAQHVPYDDLSDDEKEKDRVHVRTMMRLMGHHPEQGVEEVAPPGAKAERMVRHIKQGYARDGKLTPKEKGIAFATAWKAHNAGQLDEFARGEGGGDSGNYFKALASAWYNGVYDSGSLQKGIKTKEDIERLLDRGIVAPDGVTRKYNIDYNSDFDGVIIFSDDYYEHGDDDETDSRTGQPFGPYDYMEFSDDDLSESAMAEGRKKKKKKTSRSLGRYFFPGFGYYGSGDAGEGGGDGGGGESANPGMAEATDPKRDKLERMIWKYFGQIYDYGDDDGLNYLDEQGDLWNQLMDKYNGEIDDIVAREPTEVLMQAAQELKGIAGDMKYELDEAAQGHTIEAHGVRGMDRRTWHKTFRNTDQMMAWAEKHDAEIVGTRDLEQARHHNLSPAGQDMAEDEFDSFKFGKPITFSAYHSSKSKIKRILPTDEFYFSDDRHTWEDNYLYKIKITLKNPYVMLDQKAEFESHAKDSLPKIKAAGHDGVIYTPYSVDYGFRQGVCFYPQRQISSIKLVNQNITGKQGVAEGLTEMDKSEPSAGRDGGQQSPRRDRQSSGRDTGPRPGPDQKARPITAKKATKDVGDMFNQAFTDSHKKDVKEGEIEQTKTGIRHRGDRYGSGEELPNGGGNRSGFPNPGKYARDLDNLDKGLTSKLDHSMGISWPKGRKKQDMDESIDPLMLKLRRAMVQEGRVKELADDLKTMPDSDFMKKYGKAKAAIRKDMTKLDEAGTSRLGKKDFDFRTGLDVGDDESEFFEPDVRIGKPVEPNAADTDAFMSAVDSYGEQNPYMQSWGGKYADQDTRIAPLRPGEFNVGGTTWRRVEDPAAAPAKKEVQWIPSSEADSIASWKANNPGKSAADWGSIPAASKSAAASGLPKMRFDRATNSLVPVDQPVALDLSPKDKDKFDRQTRSVKPADGSGANANIDAATRDRARAWAAKQNAPVDAAKQKVDWKTIYALNKSTIGDNPNVIRPRMQLNMPNGTIYLVQPGDTLTKIAAKQNQVNELSTNKLGQYKTAAAQDAKAADQEGDFKRGDKRFSGIVQATKKQFDNDAKKVDENRAARRALMAQIVNHR